VPADRKHLTQRADEDPRSNTAGSIASATRVNSDRSQAELGFRNIGSLDPERASRSGVKRQVVSVVNSIVPIQTQTMRNQRCGEVSLPTDSVTGHAFDPLDLGEGRSIAHPAQGSDDGPQDTLVPDAGAAHQDLHGRQCVGDEIAILRGGLPWLRDDVDERGQRRFRRRPPSRYRLPDSAGSPGSSPSMMVGA
jgi:hypothetical protein